MIWLPKKKENLYRKDSKEKKDKEDEEPQQPLTLEQ